jgi:hypothetical protein
LGDDNPGYNHQTPLTLNPEETPVVDDVRAFGISNIRKKIIGASRSHVRPGYGTDGKSGQFWVRTPARTKLMKSSGNQPNHRAMSGVLES